MEKRIIIASILSVILILAWSYFMPHAQKATVVKQQAGTVHKASALKNKVNVKNKNLINKTIPVKSKKIINPIVISNSLKKIGKISYKSSKINATFNKYTGAINGLSLLKYSYTEKASSKKVNLSNSKNISEIINFIPKNKNTSIKLINIIRKKYSVKFIYNISGKALLIKEYKFNEGKYIFSSLVYFKNISNKPYKLKGSFVISSGLKPVSSKNPNFINFMPAVYINKSLQTPAIANKQKFNGNISFAGFNSKYFLLSALSPGSSVKMEKKGNIVSFIIPKTMSAAPGKTVETALKFYGGPKKLSLLNPVGHNLNSTLNYGFFGFFSIILLHILQFFYGYVHNYGVAIILLVIAIRLVFYPITYKGFKSMKQMQKLTPKINEMREKYKDNKAELNRKIMELYKESRVNPFGGCLPMLLQIPVFYGLYQALLISIQLRNAPFIFWIHNLSVQDPYYILPILMGISMLVSQKMNPMVGDPAQAKIMLILPIVFTFIFIHFPAGLLLYWTLNNLLTIAQQYIINKKFA